MKLKTKIIAILVAVCVVAGIVTLCVTLGKKSAGSSESTSVSETTRDSVSVSESETASETASEKESETISESNSETISEGESESETISEEESNSETTSEEESDSEEHTHTGGEATCTKKAVCEVCGEEYGELAAHDFSAETIDEKYLAAKATCEKAATYYVSCSVCGEKSENTFESGEPSGHKKTTVRRNEVRATCTSAGGYDSVVICSVCQKEFGREKITTSPALGHNWGYVSDGNGKHYQSCGRCGKKGNSEDHTYIEKIDVKYRAEEATCETKAKYYVSCSACGEKGDETFEGEALGHIMSEDFVSLGNGKHAKKCLRDDCFHTEEETDCTGGEATCTEKAVCEVCREAYGEEPAGHSWNEGEITTAATCTENGVKKLTCTACGETKNETIESAGHSYTDTVVAPGCVAKGYTSHVCETCGDAYTDNEVPAKGHNWDKEYVTCEEGRACLDCEVTEPAKGHNYKLTGTTAANCTEGATETSACSDCGDEKTVTVSDKLGHKRVAEAANDKLRDGKDSCYYIKGYKCSVCGENITDEVGEEFENHEYVASIETAATCQTEGVKKFTCANCGDVKKEIISVDTVNGHIWDNGVSDGAGKKTLTCTVENCGAAKTVIDATEKKETVVSADDITADASEVHLDGASMDLGEVKNKLTGDVTVGANILEETKKNDLLSGEDKQEIKERIGDSPIYDFTLKNDGEDVDFDGGKVRIVLPYTLQDGEDVDSIAIWYIDNDGNVKSYKATYYEVEGVGYVTFEAEHFSYYTVTRLTPEERCALYGHSEHEFVIVPTCTDIGYTLHVCLRCGNERVTDEKEAAGHKYAQTITEATCLKDGNIAYQCTVCNAAYNKVIKSEGHKWSITESVTADCTREGRAVYVCDTCNETYTVTEAKKEHTFVENVIEPTCEAAGYTVRTCTECEYSYNTNFVSALGHDYSFEWVWSEDYGAVLKTVCKNDNAHAEEITATVTVTEIKATCTTPKKLTYTAKATFNGELYVDKKEVTESEETLEHKFEEGYLYDNEVHYRKCLLCGFIAEETAHEFGKGEIVKNATCATGGERVYVCACGYVKREVIPATGDHNYVNGVCTVCGQEYTSCDHKTLHPVLITGEDLGTCKGTQIVIMTCECGQVKNMDIEGSTLACDTEANTETGKTEDGNEWQRVNTSCKICGAVYEMYMEQAITKCYYVVTGSLKITQKNEVKLNATIEYSEHRYPWNLVEENIYISDLTGEKACGGYLRISKCAECGKIEGIAYEGLACEGLLDNEPTEYEYTDENGIIHTGAYVICEKCGLKIINEDTYEPLNNCVYYRREVWQVIVGGKVIHENVFREGVDGEHETETTYEKLGETCYDGVKVTVTCKNCSYKTVYIRESHLSGEAEYITVSETCESRMRIERCRICGEITSLDYYDSGKHDFKETENKTYVDKEGNTHTYTLEKCERCGHEYGRDTYRARKGENPCEWIVCSTTTIVTEDKTNYIYINKYEQSSHIYVYTFKLEGETCENGWTATGKCLVCGKEDKREGDRHEGFIVSYYDLTELGACEGTYIKKYSCACGKEIDIAEKLCNGHELSWNVIDTEEGEYSHLGAYYECNKCKLVISADKIGVKHSDKNAGTCIIEYTTTYTITINGQTYNYVVVTKDNDGHNYEYTGKLKDGSANCEDGAIIYRTCKDCGYSEILEENYTGHFTAFEKVYLPENTCGGYYVRYYCVTCRETTSFHDNFSWCHSWDVIEQKTYIDKNGNEHTYSLKKCSECGVEYGCDEYAVLRGENPCEWIVYATKTLTTKDESMLLSYTEEREEDSHLYIYELTLNGETCEDGWTAIGKCAICGKEDEREGDWHESLIVSYYDLAKLGACEGTTFYKESCACGQNEDVVLSHLAAGISGEDISIPLGNGEIEHSKRVYSCKNCALKAEVETIGVKVVNKEAQTCKTNYTKTWIVSLGEENVSLSKHWVETDCHNYQRSGELKEGSSTCDDGATIYLTCKDCGYSEVEYEDWRGHYDTWETIELPESSCGGSIMRRYCVICNETFEFSVQGNHTFVRAEDGTYIDDDGVEHSYYVGKCADCGVERRTDDYRVLEGENPCEWTNYRIYSVTSADKTIKYSYTDVGNSSTHKYVYTLNLDGKTCDEGWTAIGKCAICGKETEVESGSGCVTFLVEYYDLEKLGACKKTYIEKYSCACGRQAWVDDYLCDDIRREDFDIPTEDGEYSHTRCTYACKTCGLKIEEELIGVKVSDRENQTCNIIYTRTRNVAIGETGIANITTEEVSMHNHTFDKSYALKDGSSSCEDGAILRELCRDCGYEKVTDINDHGMNVVEEIALTAVCGGTAYYYECPCGYEKDVTYSSKCEFNWISSSYDNESDITDLHKYFDLSSLNHDIWSLSTDHYGEMYNSYRTLKCAVTNPKQCGYVIRDVSYWKKTANCTATLYKKWQFGFNETDGSCEWEKIIETHDVCVYHEFERTEIDYNGESGYRLECKNCDSYYQYGRRKVDGVEVEKVVSENLVNNGGIKKHTHLIKKYEDGSESEICTITDANGTDHENKRSITNCIVEGFTDGRKSVIDFENYYKEEIYANHTLNNGSSCGFIIYEKITENKGAESEYRREWTYSYDFEACKYTVTYKNSNGYTSIENYNHLGGSSSEVTKMPTCSQSGEIECRCDNCGEVVETGYLPPDHSWSKISDNSYVCVICGLKNTNGVSGKIIMEDLTDYENGEDYVVGYYFRENGIENYNTVVSLVRKNFVGNVNDEIYLGMAADKFVITTEGVVSVRFGRAYVNQLALAKLGELGLDMANYNVRFSFVPVGFKEDLDYAITFEKIEDYSSEIDATSGELYLFKVDPLQNGVTITFTAKDNGFYTIATADITVRDSWGNNYSVGSSYSVSISDGETEVNTYNFSVCSPKRNKSFFVYKFDAGKTYTINITLDYVDNSAVKFFPVETEFLSDIVGKYGHKLNDEPVDYETVLVYADMEALNASGIQIFGNNHPSCEEAVQGCFTCSKCGSVIAVKIMLAHTPDESTIVESEGHRHYTCSGCNKEIDEII